MKVVLAVLLAFLFSCGGGGGGADLLPEFGNDVNEMEVTVLVHDGRRIPPCDPAVISSEPLTYCFWRNRSTGEVEWEFDGALVSVSGAGCLGPGLFTLFVSRPFYPAREACPPRSSEWELVEAYYTLLHSIFGESCEVCGVDFVSRDYERTGA